MYADVTKRGLYRSASSIRPLFETGVVCLVNS